MKRKTIRQCASEVHPELTPVKRLKWYKLTGKALRAFPGSPRQQAIQAQVRELLREL